MQVAQVLPKLAAGGIVVWRWPGGAIGDAWCPTTSGDPSPDACFQRFPALLNMGHPSTPPTFLALRDFITQCTLYACVPIVQINAAIALIYGAAAAADLTAAVLADFDAAGIGVRYLEFGNELYGVWWPAAGQLPSRTGETYAASFVATRAALLARRPAGSPPLSFGLVLTHLTPNDHEGALVRGWNDDVLRSSSGAATRADWLVVHRYFSKYDRSGNTDDVVLRTASDGLDSLTISTTGLYEHYSRSDGFPPPLALTEYNAVFIRSEACGGSQQYLSLL